jgi:hypothetical protein
MKFKLISLSLLFLFSSISSTDYSIAATDTCPENWNIQLEAPSVPFPSYVEVWHLKDLSGNLDKYKSELGFNLSTSMRVEFSSDKKNWVPLQWPMTYPDKSSFIFGSQSIHYLYPGFTRGAIRVEVKGCEKPKEFFTPEYKTPVQIIKEKYTIEQIVGNYGDFKRTEALVNSIKSELDTNIKAFSNTGRIKQSYPTDGAFVYISPLKSGCMNFEGPHPGYWVSKGKPCELIVFGNQITLNNERFNFANENQELYKPTNFLNTSRVMFVVSQFTADKVIKQVTINCLKGKSSKKVTGINPRCPAGYMKK